jgi:predicted O-linked N-acetylglucosamine transferase (SPINDLY family)
MQSPGTQQIQGLLQQAVVLHQAGRLAEAKSFYQQILIADPRHPDTLHLLGVIFFQSGDNARAVEMISRAIAIRAGDPAPYMNLGLALKAMGRPDEALKNYDKAIAVRPSYVDAWNNRGAALQDLKRLDDALASYDRAIALQPVFAEGYNNRGAVLRDLGRLDEALASYNKAITLKPGFAEALSNRGAVLHDLRRLDEALDSYQQALSLMPGYANAWNNSGALLRDLGRPEDALIAFDHAIALAPGHAEPYANRGFVLRDLKRLDEAVASFEKALSLRRAYDFLPGYCQQARMMACDWEGFDDRISRLEGAIRAGERSITPFPLLGLSDDPELQKKAASLYTENKWPRSAAAGSFGERAPGEKLRIGYYSADFHNHATAWLTAELFESHDRSRFELFAFSFGPAEADEMRPRISAAFDHFLDVRGLSDGEIARLSRQHGIDIAVDLKGHTQDSRPGIFADGCAPLQVHYLGYPGTMGANYIDYLVADSIVIPFGREGDYSEKILRLPHSYQANDSRRRISEKHFSRHEEGLPEPGFVFCCFNNNYKILPAVFESWMRILAAVDGSVLWLLQDNALAAENLRRHAAKRGVDPARLLFASRLRLDEHLARHRLADLFLDTWPYNAHTTASDALWAGLPVLTRTGLSFASRVAASLLNAVGLPELVTGSPQDYEALAIALAKDPARLAGIRQVLAANRTTSPLFDGRQIARHLEAGYETIVKRHRAGLPPADTDIPA